MLHWRRCDYHCVLPDSAVAPARHVQPDKISDFLWPATSWLARASEVVARRISCVATGLLTQTVSDAALIPAAQALKTQRAPRWRSWRVPPCCCCCPTRPPTIPGTSSRYDSPKRLPTPLHYSTLRRCSPLLDCPASNVFSWDCTAVAACDCRARMISLSLASDAVLW